MTRKLIFGLLAVVILAGGYLFSLPKHQREAFLMEYRFRSGISSPQNVEDGKGLRLEHPEEYGLGGAADESEAKAEDETTEE